MITGNLNTGNYSDLIIFEQFLGLSPIVYKTLPQSPQNKIIIS